MSLFPVNRMLRAGRQDKNLSALKRLKVFAIQPDQQVRRVVIVAEVCH